MFNFSNDRSLINIIMCLPKAPKQFLCAWVFTPSIAIRKKTIKVNKETLRTSLCFLVAVTRVMVINVTLYRPRETFEMIQYVGIVKNTEFGTRSRFFFTPMDENSLVVRSNLLAG